MTQYDAVMLLIFIPLMIFCLIVTYEEPYDPSNPRVRREDD
jgi:hypothetical protein